MANYYSSAIKINPKQIDYNYSKGAALVNNGNYSVAMQCFNKIIEIHPDEKMAWYNMGVASIALGDILKAITCFETALKIDPEYQNAWAAKVACEKELGLTNQ